MIGPELRKQLESEGIVLVTLGSATLFVNKRRLGLDPDEPIGMERLEKLMQLHGFDFSGANEESEELVPA